MFDELVTKLKAIKGVQFAEYEWKTRPSGNFGTVQLDFEAEDDNGDDTKQDRAWEGSVDLYTHGKEMMIVSARSTASFKSQVSVILSSRVTYSFFPVSFKT